MLFYSFITLSAVSLKKNKQSLNEDQKKQKMSSKLTTKLDFIDLINR